MTPPSSGPRAAGEGADDYSGPYREVFGAAAEELGATNAAALADAGGATLVADRDLTAERLVAAIAPFDDVAHRARVGAAARALANRLLG